MEGGTIDVPQVGKVKKAYVYGVIGVIGAYVLYRYWAAGSAGADEETPVDPAFGEGEVLPTVPGAYTPGGGGIPDDTGTGTGKEGPPATNDEWSRRAASELAGQGGMDYAAIVQALGAYLARKPLTSDQARLVQSAIAVMGYPPSGSFTIITGGDTPILVAPSGLKVESTTATSAVVSFSRVPGAGYYRGYYKGSGGNVAASDGSPMTFNGLQPNTTYTFSIAADTTSGKPGPQSSGVTGKTKAVTLAAPTSLKATAIGRTDITVACKAVSGATYYRWYVNGTARGSSDGPSYKITGLKANTTYKITAAADTTNQSPSKQSAAITVKTKK